MSMLSDGLGAIGHNLTHIDWNPLHGTIATSIMNIDWNPLHGTLFNPQTIDWNPAHSETFREIILPSLEIIGIVAAIVFIPASAFTMPAALGGFAVGGYTAAAGIAAGVAYAEHQMGYETHTFFAKMAPVIGTLIGGAFSTGALWNIFGPEANIGSALEGIKDLAVPMAEVAAAQKGVLAAEQLLGVPGTLPEPQAPAPRPTVAAAPTYYAANMVAPGTQEEGGKGAGWLLAAAGAALLLG